MSRDALVVGVNAYQNLPNLNAPAVDAEAVARCLERLGEFRVCRLPEVIQSNQPAIGQTVGVTTQMLEEALIRLFKPTGKNVPQTAIFYYSGHGLQRNVGIREGYLATSEANPSSGNHGLSMFWLRRLLQESPVRQRIIWLDCCHSGELLNFLEADPGAKEGTDRLFMAASREYESAYEALEGSHSVFTKALLSGLNPHRARQGIVNSHHLMEVVSSELKGELQQPLFESSGSDIILTRTAGTAAVQSSATTTLDRLKQLTYSFCPYRGLSPFEENHAAYFFGREKFTAQLADAVKTSSFCAVVGASGVGKTSVLKAGLISTLKQPAASEQVTWDIRQVTPDGNPLQRLAEAFIDPATEGIERADQLRRAETFLQAGGTGLAQLVRANLNPNSLLHMPNQRLLLVIDQFERALSPLLPESREPLDPLALDPLAIQRSQFIDCLTEVLKESNLPIHVVIGLRSDWLEPLQQYPEFYALVTRHSLAVPPMAYEDIKAAVVKPLEKLGLRYDPNLIYTLMLDLVGAPGELPLLQLTLQELWRQREKDPSGHQAPKLTLAAYAELGGVRKLLNQRATDVFQALSEPEQKAAKRIFLSLCELGEGTEDSRRRAHLHELVTPKLPLALVKQTLNKLIKAHLVVVSHSLVPSTGLSQGGLELPEAAWATPSLSKRDHLLVNLRPQRTPCAGVEQGSSVPTFDIVHESLIRAWPLLRQWLEQNREILGFQRRLEAAASEWQRQGRPTYPEYLLTGNRLRDAGEFRRTQSPWLSSLAQEYVSVSQAEARKHQWRSQAMRLLIPTSVVLGMLSSYGHYKLTQYLTQTDAAAGANSKDLPLTFDPASTAGLAPLPANGSVDTLAAPSATAQNSNFNASRLALKPLLTEHTAQLLQPVQLGVVRSNRSTLPSTQTKSLPAKSALPSAVPVSAQAVPTQNGTLQEARANPVSTTPVIVVWCTQAAAGPTCKTSAPQ